MGKDLAPKMRRAEKGQPVTLASVIRINSYARQTVGQFRILKLFIAQPGGAVRSIPLYRSHLMNIFSLSHLLELVKELPDPKQFINANRGRSSVIRLPVRDWDAVRDADHPDREFEAHENPYVEFEIIQWKNTKGVSAPRWVLRGLVAM